MSVPPQRILVMSFGSDAGGIEKSLIEFLKFLLEEGHKVDLFLWRKPGELFPFIPEGVNILTPAIHPGRFTLRGGPRKWLWYARYRYYCNRLDPTRCFRPFPGEPYDIAISYCQNGYSPHYVINKVNARRKILFYHHGSYDESGKKKSIDLHYFAKYDEIVAVSRSAARMLSGHFPSIAGKIVVINNLADEDRIRELSLVDCPMQHNKNYVNLCTVGRVSPEKGQLLALQTAKLLEESGLKFKWWFIGDGSDMGRCISFVKEHSLDEYCIFTGTLTNPYPFIKNCDLYIQPSHVEADPVTIREALILERPIVGTNIDALRDALANVPGAMVVPPDPKEIAQSILTELSAPSCVVPKQQGSVNSKTITDLQNLIARHADITKD